MSRRRYITSAASTDKRLNDIAKASDFVALFYFMMIPHVGDDCLLAAEPEELLGMVIPLRRDKDVEDVISALERLHKDGLLKWCSTRKLIMFPPKTFYKHQAYIKSDRRVSQEEYDDFCCSERGLAKSANLRQSSAESVALAAASSSVSSSVPIPASATSAEAAFERPVSWEYGTSGSTPYVKTLREKNYTEVEIRQVIDEYNNKPEPPVIRGSTANFLAGMINLNREKAKNKGSPKNGAGLSLVESAQRLRKIREDRGLTK